MRPDVPFTQTEPKHAPFKWKVKIIDSNDKIEEQELMSVELYGLKRENRKVIVHFDDETGQPDEDSGGLLGSFIGKMSRNSFVSIDYTDWRTYDPDMKEEAWKYIQNFFWFANPAKRRTYVLSVLGSRCKDLKVRLWKDFKQHNLAETMVNPTHTRDSKAWVPDNQWCEFVTLRFTEEWKKMQERNINSQKKNVILHACGRQSFARKRRKIINQTGKIPCRAEFFIESRKKQNGTFVSKEAENRAEKLSNLMSQNTSAETSNNMVATLDDEYSKVFGPEPSGRVRCVGRGPTPSKFLKHSEVAELKSQVISLQNQVQNLEKKIQQLANVQDRGGEENEVDNVDTVG